MRTQEVVDAFELLEPWEQRYELIADLGRSMLPLAESEKTDANRISGCDTRTWLTGCLAGNPRVMEYRADAEGPLVRGLVALLLTPFQGKTPDEVIETDPAGFVSRLDLEAGLSAKRLAGMYAFFARVKEIARVCREQV
jgi:cysteine desulfuration protein SufE